MCSSEENFANTIIEALMCGCPVVASDQGGSREIIANEINGYTFTLDDGHDLALKICKLVNDADFSREQISHETSLKYSSAVKAAELDRILQNACKLEE
jgi:glycosyltransferase involved in cell wall biosynthesis